MTKPLASLLLALASLASATASEAPPLRALIVDGQNNHEVWPKASFMLRRYLEDTGLFTVDMMRTRTTWRGESHLPQFDLPDGVERLPTPEPTPDPDFAPNFADYQLVVSNFGWKAADWPEATQRSFESYMANGGGLVVVHAADNSFPNWPAYNRMIGVGGWGDRDERSGPFLFFDESGALRREYGPGKAGTHGKKHAFPIVIRDPSHPITAGLPELWMHNDDECYGRLRGPAENLAVLASAYSDPATGGTGKHEPMLMAIQYEKGRVFHTTLGHDEDSLQGVGFIVTFARGAEWAATAAVTQPVPPDFPTITTPTSRPFAP